MRRVVTAIVLAALAGGSALAADGPLTPDGWGALRIGMPEGAAARLLKVKVPPDDEVNSFACREIAAGDGQVVIMMEKGRLSRISLHAPGPLRTDKGFGVGSKEADVRRAYGAALEVATHAYDEEPAHYLTYWTIPKTRGVRYETDTQGLVTAVHVGGPAIQYIEGCL